MNTIVSYCIIWWSQFDHCHIQAHDPNHGCTNACIAILVFTSIHDAHDVVIYMVSFATFWCFSANIAFLANLRYNLADSTTRLNYKYRFTFTSLICVLIVEAARGTMYCEMCGGVRNLRRGAIEKPKKRDVVFSTPGIPWEP